MDTRNLLVELFVEELPPKALAKIGEAFARTLYDSLQSQGLLDKDSVLTPFASPRRLGVHITAVAAQADDRPVSQKLMPASVGLAADGKATPALLKKLHALGADESAVAGLKRESDGKTDVLFFNSVVEGATLAKGLQKALEETLARLPIPKVMTYQLADGWESVHFVRPAHGLVALYGSDVVPVSVLGLTAGNTTHGHRFEAGIDPLFIRSADTYATQLASEGAVIASFAERRAEILRQLQAAAASAGDKLTPIEDDALLDEVTGLVERPNVLVGQFEESFLDVPQECLILTMKTNQKYFPLLDARGKLTNRFLIVSNIRPADTGAVIGGNERVVRPRLADAKFFFDQDRKKTLESRVPGLAKVVYHGKLGSQLERIERVRSVAGWVAMKLGTDEKLAERAALLSKADLLTDMVGEFPELQGIMGGYYARHDGENEQVVRAIADQYAVRRDEEQDASNLVGEALLIADRIEILLGIWAIGLKPTGDKDPYALRRHALGIIRSFELCSLAAAIGGTAFELLFDDLLDITARTFKKIEVTEETRKEVRSFVFDRYQNQLSPLFGVKTVDSVIALEPPLDQVVTRVKAVMEFQRLPEAASLAAANKRVSNILKKVDGAVVANVDPRLLNEAAEVALNDMLAKVKPQADAAFERGDYTASLQALAALKVPVDAFFEGVMVNADDDALRNNRLGLLASLHQAMNRVADLSRLAA
jgi:glycyl-tRNA synthetase beta chain